MFSSQAILSLMSVGLSMAQNDGRYRPEPKPVRIPTVNPLVGRYRGGGGDGRYNPAADGRYVPSNDGKYVHIAGKDGPGDAGYVGGIYTGGPGGKYTGGNGAGGGAGGAGRGGSAQGNRGSAASGSGVGVGVGGAGSGNKGATTQRTYVTKGAPPDGWEIIRNEKTESVDGYHYL